MILDTISGTLKDMIIFVLNLLPTITLGTSMNGFNDWLISIFDSINYFIPLRDLIIILGVKYTINNSHIIYNLFLKIVQLIRG